MSDLPFQTITQFVALGLTLIAGWFLGLASSSGGRKWRERYYDEELSSAGYRDRAETDLRDAAQRIRNLEADNARLRAEVLAAQEAVPVAAPAPVPVVAPAPPPSPVEPAGHSTATVLGAAVAGAAAGAAVTHAAEHRDEPVPEAAAPPVHAPPAPVAPPPAEAPIVEAAPVPAPDAGHAPDDDADR